MLLGNNVYASHSDVIYFYNWSEYVPPGLLEQFTKETGIRVIYSTYESNETLYAKLKTHPDGGYDLITPSTYFIKKMAKEGMLQKIDHNKLSNYRHLDPALLHQSFDPENQYSIPYFWGGSAIGVNSDEINPNTIKSWADLWRDEYKDQLLLLDDTREVFAIALHKLGYSGNTINPEEIEKAYQELKKLMPNVRAFNSDSPANPFIEGEVNIGMIWNGSAYIARKEGVAMHFIWPEDGAVFWMDSLSIPAKAKNVEGALKLIDFLLRPDIAAKISLEVGYPTPNLTARQLLPKQIANDKSLYPDPEILKKGEWQNDVGQANEIYEKYYQRLKTGR